MKGSKGRLSANDAGVDVEGPWQGTVVLTSTTVLSNTSSEKIGGEVVEDGLSAVAYLTFMVHREFQLVGGTNQHSVTISSALSFRDRFSITERL